MEIVFFVYGLAFFVLGLSIFVYPRKGSEFGLAAHLYLIAGFGLLHGTNEWVDMLILITKPDPAPVFEASRMFLLPGSFWFLVMFGVKTVAETKRKLSLIKALPIVLPAIWFVLYISSGRSFSMGDICSRYLICVPGTLLTAYGLLLYLPQLEKTKLTAVIRNLKVMAVTWLVYGFIAGVIVRKADFFPASILNYEMVRNALGFPVQILRAACASILLYSTLRVLSVFHWETQNALRESDLRFRSIVTAAPIILFLANKDGTITFADGRGLDELAIKPDQVIGKHVRQLFVDSAQSDEDVGRALAGEECVSTLTSNGVIFEMCYSPMRDKDNQIIGLIGVALDVTRRVEAQAELENYREDMAGTRRLAELGTMSATVGQQLDEPLNVARLLLERLLSDVAGCDGAEALTGSIKKSFAEVSKAVSILDRFHSCAQLSPTTRPEPVDLYAIVRRLIAVFAERARRSNLKIIVKGVDIVPCMAIATRELEQVFFILIQNAIEAANPSKDQQLTISCQIEDKLMRLAFADTCRAIAAEELEYIFDPLSPRATGDNANLGLATIKRILPVYGGTIEVESEQGKGTTFYVTLPVERVY
jgi:PAS domain S-box-containing protein